MNEDPDDTRALKIMMPSLVTQLTTCVQKLDRIAELLQGELGKDGLVHKVNDITRWRKDLEEKGIWETITAVANINKLLWIIGPAYAVGISAFIIAVSFGKVGIRW